MFDKRRTSLTQMLYHFIFLAAPHSMWDLSSLTGIEPKPPAVGAWSLNHWNSREVPEAFLSSQKENPHPLAITLPFPHPLSSPRQTLICFCLCGLPLLHISPKWGHAVCSLLCLASFKCIMFSKFFHVTCISSSLVSMAE